MNAEMLIEPLDRAAKGRRQINPNVSEPLK